MTTICTPPSTLRFGSVQPLLEALARSPSQEDEKLLIDFRTLRWVEALPLAVLAAYMLRHKRSQTTGGTIKIPPKYAYLQRMNLFEVVGAQVPPETFRRRSSEGRFIPLEEVQAIGEVSETARRMVETLRVEDEEAQAILRHCIGELLDNVFIHANSITKAIVCAQHFPNAKRSQVAIVDCGMGFRASFVNSPAFPNLGAISDRDALKLGIAPYITSKPPGTISGTYSTSYGRLGVGLFIVSEILALVGGRLLVASGEAMYRRTAARESWLAVHPWEGAIVGFELPDEPDISYHEASHAARAAADEIRKSRKTSD